MDSAQLRERVCAAGAELVIHGHNHRSEFRQLEGPDGIIPVVGVRSASYAGENRKKTAQYHLYRMERSGSPGTGPRYRVELRVREWNAAERNFVEVGSPRSLSG